MRAEISEKRLQAMLEEGASAFPSPNGLKADIREQILSKARRQRLESEAARGFLSAFLAHWRGTSWGRRAALALYALGLVLMAFALVWYLGEESTDQDQADLGTASLQEGPSLSPVPKEAAATGMLISPPPGSGEVLLDRSLDGERVTRTVSEGGWVQIGNKGFWWPSSDRKILGFSQEGPRIYVTIEDAPPRKNWEQNREWEQRFTSMPERPPRQLAGVWLRTPNDLEELRKALENEPGPLTLWCSCQPPAELAEIPFLPHMEKITAFQQVEPTALIDLSPLEMLTGLTALDVRGCRQILKLKPLANLTELMTVNLSGCTSLRDLEGLHHLKNLTYLNLSGCTSLMYVELWPLQDLKNLRTLDLSACINLADLSHLKGLSNLTKLDLSHVCQWHPCDLAPLAKLTRLKHLDLRHCGQVRDIAPLGELTNLTFLDLLGCKATDFSALARLTNLEHLNLGACRGLHDLSPLASLKKLEKLSLWSCDKVSDISPLSKLTNLTELNMRSREVSDLSPLVHLENLKSLDLRGCTQVSDISPLANLVNLEKLYLRCEQISDVSPLARLPNLTSLGLIGCPNVTDISALREFIQRRGNLGVEPGLRPQLEELKRAISQQ